MKYFSVELKKNSPFLTYLFYNVSNGDIFAEIVYQKPSPGYPYITFSYSALEEYELIKYELRDVLNGIIGKVDDVIPDIPTAWYNQQYSFDEYIKPLFRGKKIDSILFYGNVK